MRGSFMLISQRRRLGGGLLHEGGKSLDCEGKVLISGGLSGIHHGDCECMFSV